MSKQSIRDIIDHAIHAWFYHPPGSDHHNPPPLTGSTDPITVKCIGVIIQRKKMKFLLYQNNEVYDEIYHDLTGEVFAGKHTSFYNDYVHWNWLNEKRLRVPISISYNSV